MSTTIQRHQPGPRMSKAVRHAGLIYLCGQTSAGSEAADIAAQTQEVLARIDALLQAQGSDRSRLLAVTIHLRSMEDFGGMNQVWESWIAPGCAPARTTVEAALARPELLVEMTVVAAA